MSDIVIQEYDMYVTHFIELLNTQAVLLGITAELMREKINKPNESLDAIAFHFEKSELAPTIYPEKLYEEYLCGNISIEEQATRTLYSCLDNIEKIPKFDTKNLNREYIQEHAYYKIMNASINKEIAKDTASVPFHDLILVPYVNISKENGSVASFRLNRDIQERYLQMTDSEIQKCCYQNLQKENFQLLEMNEIMRHMMEEAGLEEGYIEDVLPYENQMYVLRNEIGVGGAVALASKETLQMAHEEIGENYFVIPSSIHECLLIPESFVSDPSDLKEMCESVNNNEEVIKKEDILGDNIYRFDGQKLSICNSLDDLKQQTEPQKQCNHIRRGM